MSITKFTLPYNGWTPRPHQMKLWRYLRDGGDRAIAIWHRRAGKDDVTMHHTAMAAAERVGNYWHCLPEFAQSRRAIWSAVNPHTGKRRIDEAFPIEWRENTNDASMFIRLKNGSTWSCIGSDSFDKIVGSSPAGIVFSEFALCNPSVWGYFRPMLQENGGWAVFISTPRGHNHCKTMYDLAMQSPHWFAELLTVEDTGVMNQDELAEALAELTALYGIDAGRANYEQELFCSFNAAILGSFYASEMAAVRKDGRISDQVVAKPDQLVHRAWDLGVHDDTSIWWFQVQASGQLFILDHYAASGVGLEHYLGVIEQKELEHGWPRGHDYVPHDAKILEWGAGRTRVETMAQLGLKPLLVPKAFFDDGVNAVRRTLPLCCFHPRTEHGGVSALEQYRREWDDEKKAFRASAVHDWTSHPADSFRYLSQAWKPQPARIIPFPTRTGIVIPPPPEPRRGGIIL